MSTTNTPIIGERKFQNNRIWQFNGDAWVEVWNNPPKTHQEKIELIMNLLRKALEKEKIFNHLSFYATNH